MQYISITITIVTSLYAIHSLYTAILLYHYLSLLYDAHALAIIINYTMLLIVVAVGRSSINSIIITNSSDRRSRNIINGIKSSNVSNELIKYKRLSFGFIC